MANPETPANGFPAQHQLTAREQFIEILNGDLLTLIRVWGTVKHDPLRSTETRDALRRDIAGVIAHCETLRLALEKGLR